MRRLYLRIYLAMLASLAIFALIAALAVIASAGANGQQGGRENKQGSVAGDPVDRDRTSGSAFRSKDRGDDT